MDPYVAAVDKGERWIMKHIKRDGFFDDLCRHPGLSERVEGLNGKFAAAGLSKRLVFKDGGNQLYLE